MSIGVPHEHKEMTPIGRDPTRRKRAAFSLVELVMVVVIIGIISAIAVPRVTRASQRADLSALTATLTNVRKAIDIFYAEHGTYTGYNPATKSPDGSLFVEQLTLYSDVHGNVNAKPGSPNIYGPYLRTPFPTNPFNNLSTVHVKQHESDADPPVDSAGWIAVLDTGAFYISATEAQVDQIAGGMSGAGAGMSNGMTEK